MNKDFIELTKENLPTKKIITGKIIKSNKVKIRDGSRIISNEEYTQPNLNDLDNTSQSTNENNKLFTFKPEYNENDLVELSVNCSCGNHTKIVFKKEGQELISEEPKKILQSESDESIEELKQSESDESTEELKQSEN